MKTIKLITFKLMLLFLTTILFVNCESDTALDAADEVLEVAKEAPFSSRLVYTSEIESNSIISGKLRRLTQNRNNASFENDSNGFSVETDVAKYVEKSDGSGYSYTFAISRDNEISTELENLVLSVNNDTQQLSTVIIKYQYTAIQLQELLNTGHVSTYTETIVTLIEGDFSDLLAENNSLPCTVHLTTYHITPDTGQTFEYGQNSACQHTNATGYSECEVYTVMNVWCPSGTSSGGSSTTTNTPSNPNSTDPSNNTTNGGTTTSPNTNTPPNNNVPSDEIVTTPLTKLEITTIKQQLDDQFGEDSWEFVDEALGDEAPSFDSVEELQEYIQSQPNIISASQSSSSVDQSGDAITRFTFPVTEYLNIVSLNIEVISKTENFATGQEFEIVGINSSLSGLAVVKKWEPNENHAVITSPNNGNFKRIIITGTIKTGAVVAGVEIFYYQLATIILELNKYNGDDGDSEMTLTPN